jgi:hypothetical protein
MKAQAGHVTTIPMTDMTAQGMASQPESVPPGPLSQAGSDTSESRKIQAQCITGSTSHTPNHSDFDWGFAHAIASRLCEFKLSGQMKAQAGMLVMTTPIGLT